MAKTVNFLRVENSADYLKVSEIAHTIWREYYAPILSTDQIEYMLEKFQSPEQIAIDCAHGYSYFILRNKLRDIGYMGVEPNNPPGKLFLSKFYLYKGFRGDGYGTAALNKLTERAVRLRQRAIWLTVNKANASQEMYKKRGFEIIREQCADIGGGYFMDDFIMEKTV